MADLRCLVVGVVLILAVTVNGAVPEDEIRGEDLPGWNKPLPSKQYSGYIDLNDTYGKSLHYWFVESEEDPESAPLLLWLNGGPGCSSLDGYFNEMGPLHFNRSGYTSGLPQLIYNPWTWTKVVNMIFLEAPAGVGFSYAASSKGYNHDDNSTADDNYMFLHKWFEKFNEFRKNDFYITGESYAGIYVPTLVNKIRVTEESMINLKGFAVGNGCIGSKVGGCSNEQGLEIHVEFFHNHGLFSDIVYKDIVKYCGDYRKLDKDCINALDMMGNEIGKVNIYDIYDVCSMNLSSPYTRAINPIKTLLEERALRSQRLGTTHQVGGPYDCIDDHVEKAYFDDPKVREVIHVASHDKIGGWSICTSKINYRSTINSLLPVYPTLIDHYHTLIFNGDVDGCVPYIGNEQWTSGLGLPVKKAWSPWMVDDQVAGYVTEYEAKTSFRFVTVKGAGHMVPQYQPKFAYYLLQRFILN